MPTSTSIKTALITGATHGIGFELSKILLNDGWIVFGTGRDIQHLNLLKETFSTFKPIQADFRCNRDIQQVADVIRKSGLALQLFVQNAGMKSPPRPLTAYDSESIDEVFQVNLLAPMKLIPLLINTMAPHSRILFITSRAANAQLKEGSTYCASKAALDQIAAILRKELENTTIGVNSIIPGEVNTRIQALIRDTKTFHLQQVFKDIHENGQLIEPSTCAQFIKWVLCDLPFEDFRTNTQPISIYDAWHHPYWLLDPALLPACPF